jgi:branched-chain amino acid transport system permease protein
MFDAVLIAEQTLNGIQLGLMLFLMAAGLTLTLGIMNLTNLAHGSFYMLGGYFAFSLVQLTGSFLVAAIGAVLATIMLGVVVEIVTFRRLYNRHHLDQVLATFGLILFFNEAAQIIWGREPRTLPVPAVFSGQVELFGTIQYPVYRLAITCAALLTGVTLFVCISFTRVGMLIRAGANNRVMLGALGTNIGLLYTFVFGIAAALAGFAGLMTAPILSVQVGMGEQVLILVFVVIVIGGIGSVGGAFVAALVVGMVTTFAQLFLPLLLGSTTGPAIASMTIYLLMAVVLVLRPTGLFASDHG